MTVRIHSKNSTWNYPRYFFHFVVHVLFVLLLVACNRSDATTSKKITDEKPSLIIGFSQIGAESAWRTCNTASMQQAALDANIQMIYANAEQKQENQIKAIRSFIVYQVDVIVFVPIVQDGWDNVLREARDARIPVIILDRKINMSDETLFAGYIGSDRVEEGRNAARFLQKKFMGKKGTFNILELAGTEGASVTDDRHKGFVDVLNKDKRFNIIYSESGDFLRSGGRDIGQRILSQNSGEDALSVNGQRIDIVFSHNDSMTLGFLDALDNRYVLNSDNIVFVTIDAEQSAIDALKSGKLNCVIECNPKLGPECMRLVKLLADGQKIPPLVYVPECIFSEFDDLSNIEPRGY